MQAALPGRGHQEKPNENAGGEESLQHLEKNGDGQDGGHFQGNQTNACSKDDPCEEKPNFLQPPDMAGAKDDHRGGQENARHQREGQDFNAGWEINEEGERGHEQHQEFRCVQHQTLVPCQGANIEIGAVEAEKEETHKGGNGHEPGALDPKGPGRPELPDIPVVNRVVEGKRSREHREVEKHRLALCEALKTKESHRRETGSDQ